MPHEYTDGEVGLNELNLEHPVEKIILIEDSYVVLYQYTTGADAGTDRNLVRILKDGTRLWIASPPEGSGDAWVAVEYKDGELVANSWSCWACKLDPETGAILTREFIK